MGMHTSTASRIISRVSASIASLRPRYINMPEGNELLDVQRDFYDIARFPRVIGCIDGTHIRVQSPGKKNLCISRVERNVIYIIFSVKSPIIILHMLKQLANDVAYIIFFSTIAIKVLKNI